MEKKAAEIKAAEQKTPDPAEYDGIYSATLPNGGTISFFCRKTGPAQADVMQKVRGIAADALKRARGRW